MSDGNKLLLLFPDRPIVRCSVERALESGVAPVGVVVDSVDGSVAEALHDLPVELLANPDTRNGAATSVRRAATWALERNSALVLTLADEPTLDPSVVRTLVDHWTAHERPMLRARYQDRPGHPVLLSRTALLEASGLEGDTGFGSRFQAEGADEVSIPGLAPIDIDDESDYQEALARLAH